MKILYILRHAKSSWDYPDLSDFDRPLNSRGLDAARFVGELIYERKLQPQVIVSSPAKRAKQTAILVKEIAEISNPIIFDERIYEASSLSLFNLVREFDYRYNSVLLVGHNPGLEDLLRILTRKLEIMPTATLSKITLDIDSWADLSMNKGNLEFVIRPKEEMKNIK